MESLDYLYNLMDESIITILGYDFTHEYLKDEFISRLKHYNVGEINSSFDVKSTIRDIKLDSILGDGRECEYLVLDTMDIIVKKEDAGMSKALNIKMILETFRTELLRKWDEQNETEFGLDFDDPQSHQQVKFKPDYKLLVTSPTYRTVGKELNFGGRSFSGGNHSLYVADLAGVITKDKLFEKPYIKLIKNRSGSNKVDISIEDIIKTANRDRKINSILPK